MNVSRSLLILAVLPYVLSPGSSAAATCRVWAGSPSDGPGTDWANAFHAIQDAVNAAADGDAVLVTNGMYMLESQITVTNQIALRSISGAEVTIINANGLVTSNRCFLLSAPNVLLEGFTITNGFVPELDGGGIYVASNDCVVRACTVVGNVGEVGGGIYLGGSNGVVQNCVMANNHASGGGGVAMDGPENKVEDCLIHDNKAGWGGGVAFRNEGLVSRCTILHNGSWSGSGGGVSLDLYNATGRVANCFISGNYAYYGGGIASDGNGTILEGNTIVGNSARQQGGGLRISSESMTNLVVRNLICYYNDAPLDPNFRVQIYYEAPLYRLEHCCTTPMPLGWGNTTNPPGLLSLDNPHLVASSPCFDTGTNTLENGPLDIDGEVRVQGASVEIGCDETVRVTVGGPLSVAIHAVRGNAALGQPLRFESRIQGLAGSYTWDLGDGRRVTDTCVVQHTYATPGTFAVILTATNLDSFAAATQMVHVATGYTNYVSLTGTHVAPYESWATAATNIQAAIDANSYAGGVTLVAPGRYDQGESILYGARNRVSIHKPITLCAQHPDPAKTLIIGQGPVGEDAIRCVCLGAGATLAGFTLTNGATAMLGQSPDISGGGVLCERGGVVSNCVALGNQAYRNGGGISCWQGASVLDSVMVSNAAPYGGGLSLHYGARAVRCRAEANDGEWEGGGISAELDSWVEACSAFRNTAGHGGGIRIREGTVATNCTVTSNQARGGSGGMNIFLDAVAVDCVIRDNLASSSGGGASLSSGCLMRDCLIERNSATNSTADAGGVNISGSTLEGCTLRWNTCGRDGGAVYIRNVGSLVLDCVMEHNWAGRYGGGVRIYRNGTMERCTVHANQSGSYAGGIDCTEGGVVLDCLIADNYGNGRAGGLQLYKGGSADRCVIRGNETWSSGGGLYIYDTGTCSNSVFHGNVAGRGGGAYFYRGGLVENCTIVGNRAGPGLGGGANGSGGGILRNTISLFNTSEGAPNYTGDLTFDHCCTMPSVGGNSLTNDPLFMALAASDFRLSPASPCVNAGTSSAESSDLDLDGAARIVNGIVDIGAYELGALVCGFSAAPGQGVIPLAVDFTGYATGADTGGDLHYWWDLDGDGTFDTGGLAANLIQHTYHEEGIYTVRLLVSNATETATFTRAACITALGANTHYVSHAGSHTYPFNSWATAANDIQSAVDAALPGATVLVAEGVYPVFFEINVPGGVQVASVAGPERTLVDGEGRQRCFYLEGDSLVSGFTIENGEGLLRNGFGAGVWIADGGTVSNCVIRNCHAYSRGGAFHIEKNGAVVDSIIHDNGSDFYGGGGSVDVTGRVDRCTIVGNYAKESGGGIYLKTDGLVRDCELRDNTASRVSGGGVYAESGGHLERCQLVGNVAGYFGAGASLATGTSDNCLVFGNVLLGPYGGGIIYGGVHRHATVISNYSSSVGGGALDARFLNSIVYHNAAQDGGDNHTNCVFTYSCTTPLPPGDGNTATDPRLVDPAAGNGHPRPDSPCIDIGTATDALTDDLDGAIRPLDGNGDGTNTFDMGCYEFDVEMLDSNGDGVPDGWYRRYGFDPLTPDLASTNPDQDPYTTGEEYVADTNPTNAASYLRITAVANVPPLTVYFASSSNRVYTLQCRTNLVTREWTTLPGAPRPGRGGADWMTDSSPASPLRLYRIGVARP